MGPTGQVGPWVEWTMTITDDKCAENSQDSQDPGRGRLDPEQDIFAIPSIPGRHMAKLILYGKGRIAGGIGCITGNSIKILSGYYCIWDVAVPELTSFKQADLHTWITSIEDKPLSHQSISRKISLPLMLQVVFLRDDHRLCGSGQSRSWSS